MLCLHLCYVLLQDCSSIRGLLWFYMNFRTVFLDFCEKRHWNFGMDFIDYVGCFVYNEHFNNSNSSNSWIWDIFSLICVLFNFFHQCFIFSLQRSFTSLLKLIHKYFILFIAIANGIFLMSFLNTVLLMYKNITHFYTLIFVSWNITQFI